MNEQQLWLAVISLHFVAYLKLLILYDGAKCWMLLGPFSVTWWKTTRLEKSEVKKIVKTYNEISHCFAELPHNTWIANSAGLPFSSKTSLFPVFFFINSVTYGWFLTSWCLWSLV